MIWKNPNRNRRVSPSTRQIRRAFRAPRCALSGCAPARVHGSFWPMIAATASTGERLPTERIDEVLLDRVDPARTEREGDG